MEFKTQPCIVDIEFFLQVVDNALADVTERSDIIGKYFDINLIHVSFFSIFNRIEI
jgi:hypothetical protein